MEVRRMAGRRRLISRKVFMTFTVTVALE